LTTTRPRSLSTTRPSSSACGTRPVRKTTSESESAGRSPLATERDSDAVCEDRRCFCALGARIHRVAEPRRRIGAPCTPSLPSHPPDCRCRC
jgi:hypothetical protein